MNRLIAAFKKLPSVGAKTAMRYAYRIVDMDEKEVEEFANALLEAKAKIHFCSACGNYTDEPTCKLCRTRNKEIICVVSYPRDVLAFEKMGGFEGVYHVLHGVIDFQKGKGADDIRIAELINRLSGVKEVILATNADVCGELTASYIAKLLKPLGVKVTRLAYGISIGSEIEYADELTLQRALSDRREM